MPLDEFELIRRYFSATDLAFTVPGLALGIGDDCALLEVPAGEQLAMSMDCLQEGVHFPAACDPWLLAQKALRVNLSDLAAMGARPLCFTLGLSIPQVDEHWLEQFSRGLAAVAQTYDCSLVGGDTTRGPLSVCIQVQGTVPAGAALRRCGANPGDEIFVTGTLGDSAAALPYILGGPEAMSALSESQGMALEAAYYQPEPRVAAGLLLRDLASAAIDISDGLASDLGHIVRASEVGAEVYVDSIPMSSRTASLPSVREGTVQTRRELQLCGGDDYELCFTVAPQRVEAMLAMMAASGIPVSRVGTIVQAPGIRWQDEQGQTVTLSRHGYKHFDG